jgi:outer membrane receptor protein involved in Fe transport
MKVKNSQVFKKSALCLALSSALAIPTYSYAEEAAEEISVEGIERIQVTASRRASTVQEAPLNITALDSDVMKEQNISKLTDIARFVPGLSIPEQGRGGNNIIVRGLNTNGTGPDSDGGTVATYFGEMPLAVDVRLIDVERVEVLIGPQGTLYGAGTLGGAIRYIPNKAEFDVTSFEFSVDAFNGAESDDIGSESSFVLNVPLIDDELAVRASVNYYNDPGFIDYNYVVKEGGVSNPDNLADTRKVADANSEEVFTSRLAVRWTPIEEVDATLTYLYQKGEFGGRSTTQYQALGPTNPLRDTIGKYENAGRYLEPDENTDSLISLDLNIDLGFAELVSATGFSESENLGQRDQTDLLYSLNYSYETFPSFSAFTRETADTESLTQEVRLVSQSESALSWIVGGYYNKATDNGSYSAEFTPGYGDFAGLSSHNDLEYLSFGSGETVEKALFGELSYQINDKLNVTVGARFYEYEIEASSAVSIAYWDDAVVPGTLTFAPGNIKSTEDSGDGNLFKFNASYQFTDDIMAYATVSEGFRLGGTNGIAACPDPLPGNQIVCALPHEFSYQPDTTTNYELGFKSTWLNNRFYFNATLFSVDWDGAQVSSAATENGNQPYTANAGTANSQGFELLTRAMITDDITAFATYAYAKAELTSDVPGLFKQSLLGTSDTALLAEYSGFDGDRLPASPEKQFSMGVNYTQDILDDKVLDIVYGLTYQSDIITRTGLRAEGETIPGFALSNLSATISADEWSVTLYVDNMFNKYAFTGARSTPLHTGVAAFPSEIGNTATVGQYRAYGHYITAPRTIGLKFNYLFDM